MVGFAHHQGVGQRQIGTAASVVSETGWQPSTIAEVHTWRLRYYAAHPTEACYDTRVYYTALKYLHRKPKKAAAATLGCHRLGYSVNPTMLQNTTRPCLVQPAEVCHAFREAAIRWDDRFEGGLAPNANIGPSCLLCKGDTGLWNHVAHFDTLHATIWDGFPIACWKPTKWPIVGVPGSLKCGVC